MAGGLQRAVDPVQWLAHHLQLVDGVGAGGCVEFHGLPLGLLEDGGERALGQLHLEGVLR
ncbi:hypothetical protein D9M71_801400 [compost metagenome]